MKFLLILSVLLTAHSVSVQAADGHLSSELQASIQKRIAEGSHPGIIIGIVDEAGFHYYGFGKSVLPIASLKTR